MTTKRKHKKSGIGLERPRAFVTRLILADLIAKRGRGPLERKRLAYLQRKP